VARELSDSGRVEVEVASDMTSYDVGTQIVYIPPKVVQKAVQMITEEELKRRVGKEVVKMPRGSIVTFKVISGQQQPSPLGGSEQPIRQQQPSPPAEDDFSRALKEISSTRRGVIKLVLEFDEKSWDTIRNLLNALKKFIKRIEVVSSGG